MPTVLNTKVLVRPDTMEEKTLSGRLYVPQQAQEKPQIGTVIAVGRGRLLANGERVPLSVVVGDHVLYGKYSCTEVTINSETLLVIDEDHIHLILDC